MQQHTSTMSAHHLERPKKSFEFRMCKKVAELTQVVHMLFTRNHEKEVEIDALKKSYEREIELVLEDAKGKIGHLEQLMADMQNQSIGEFERQVCGALCSMIMMIVFVIKYQ